MGFQAHHVAKLISSSSKYLNQGLDISYGGGRKVGLSTAFRRVSFLPSLFRGLNGLEELTSTPGNYLLL